MDIDPYYKWLAIPLKDQPPHHYRLLALEIFESDRDVISNAADQRMLLVRSFQSGQQAALSQKLLNEIAAAKVCLMDPVRKQDYDARLRASLERISRMDTGVVTSPARTRSVNLAGSKNPKKEPRRRSRQRRSTWVMLGGLAIMVCLVVAAGLRIFSPIDGGSNQLNALKGPSQGPKESGSKSQTEQKPPPPVDGHLNSTTTSGVTGTASAGKIQLRAISPQRLKQNSPLRWQVQLEDVEGKSKNVRFFLGPEAPTGMALDADSGVLTWTPMADDRPGEYVVPVFAVAGGGEQRAERSFTVLVEAAEEQPVFRSVPDQTTDIGKGLRVETSPNLGGGSPAGCRYSLVAGPHDAGIDASTGVFTWMPDEHDASQNFEVKVRCMDGRGRQHETVFAIHVSAKGGNKDRPAADSVPPATAANNQFGRTFGELARTMDDKSDSVKFAGEWGSNSTSTPRYGTGFRFAQAGSASTAEFQFADLPPGHYRVFSTWLELANRSTKATFVINNGDKKTILTVNQTNPPRSDTKDGDRPFELLTSVFVDKVLDVTLSSAPDNYVIADAVRVERVPEGPRAAIPTAAEQSKATEQIHELFVEEFRRAAGNSAGRSELAQQLVSLSRKTHDDAAARYSLYREAAELARLAGQPRLFIRIVDEWALFFDVNVVQEKQAGLTSLAKSVHSDETAIELTRAMLMFVDELAERDEWDRAGTMIRLAVSTSNKARDLELRKSLSQRSREVLELKKIHQDFSKGLEDLKNNPQNAAANRSVGFYLAFVKARWSDALPHLTLCDDAKVAAVARAELAAPEKPDDRKRVADGWVAIAKGIDIDRTTARYIESAGGARNVINRHALLWYRNALPGLVGLARQAVEKQITELDELDTLASHQQQSQSLRDVLLSRRWLIKWRTGPLFRDVQFKSDGTWVAIQVIGGRSTPMIGRWRMEGSKAVVSFQGFVDVYRLNGNDLEVERSNSTTKAIVSTGVGTRQQ